MTLSLIILLWSCGAVAAISLAMRKWQQITAYWLVMLCIYSWIAFAILGLSALPWRDPVIWRRE